MPQPQFANSSSSIRALLQPSSIVTFTWTRPVQTHEIVLPLASPYIIYVIQCLRVTEWSSSIQQGDCSSRPHGKASLHTVFTYHSHWSDHRCAHDKYAHTPMQKPLCPHLSFVRTVSNIQTQELAYCTPAPSNPPPRSKQPPSGLVRANPAVDSAAPIATPPSLWVAREMKALGVHYKTTTAAAGDRPPGATKYSFSSLHPHRFAFCCSVSWHQCTSLQHTPQFLYLRWAEFVWVKYWSVVL